MMLVKHKFSSIIKVKKLFLLKVMNLRQISIIFVVMLSSYGSLGLPRQRENSMLQQLSLIRHKITNLELNLYHVLSKVIFLTDADVHNPRRQRQPDNCDDKEKEIHHLVQEQEQTICKQDVLQSIKHMESLLQRLVDVQMSPENKTTAHKLNQTDNIGNQNEEQMVPIYEPAKAECSELEDGHLDGIYRFLVPELNEIDRNFNERFCIFATDGPAWTVIQQQGFHEHEYENFNRTWDEYRAGFGSLSKDFWFGNEFIHKILYRDDHLLRIELEDQQGRREWAEYGLFRLDSEIYNYQLTVDEFQGSLTDGLEYHNKMDFSTFDHGTTKGESCAVNSSSGWWFNNCQVSNLNGDRRTNGIVWANWQNLRKSRMLIRRRVLLLEENAIEDD